MQLLERAEGSGQKVDADRRAGTDAQVAALDATQLLELQRGFVEDVEGTARVSVEDRPRLGELHAFAESIQQRHSERLLELFDLVRDRRLAEPQLLRGLAEAAEVGHRFEGAQLTQRHRAVEIQLRAVLGHGAYDMRYGRPPTKEHGSRSPHPADPPRRRR